MKPIINLVETAFSPVKISRKSAIRATEVLSTYTHIISSLEHLAASRKPKLTRFNEWENTRGILAHFPESIRQIFDLIGRQESHRAIHISRVIVGAGILITKNSKIRGAGDWYLVFSSLILNPRNYLGSDGSDQASFLSITAAALSRSTKNTRTQDAVLWYTSLQAGLSYAISGWVKYAGGAWRSGQALENVMRTQTYGNRQLWAFSTRHRRISVALVHSILFLESIFPFVFVGRGRFVRVILSGTTGFHLANAVVMGLNRFAPAFISLYPAVMYTQSPQNQPLAADRDDSFLSYIAVGLGATAIIGFIGYQLGHWKKVRTDCHEPRTLRTCTTRGYETQRVEITASLQESARSSMPLAILIHGLGTSGAQLSSLAQALEERGFPTLTIDRHRRLEKTSQSRGQNESAHEDIQESIKYLVLSTLGRTATLPSAEITNEVILIGHSLGAVYARELARSEAFKTQLLVSIDGNDPRGPLTAGASSSPLAESLAQVPLSLQLGLGWTMEMPSWIAQLPESARQKAKSHYTDHRRWQLAHYEWVSYLSNQEKLAQNFPATDIPVLAFTSSATQFYNPQYCALHHAFAHDNQGNTGGHYISLRTDHDSIVADNASASAIAQTILNEVENSRQDPDTRQDLARPNLSALLPEPLTVCSCDEN